MADSRLVLWPVEWQKPVDSTQAAMGMRAAAAILAELSPRVQMRVVIRAGGGEPLRAWIGASTDESDGDAISLVASTIKSLVPWLGLGLDEAVDSLPRLDGTVGMTFDIYRGESGGGRVIPVTSSFLRVLENSSGRWQLTMSSGMRLVDEQSDRIDFSMSLVGTGSEIAVASALLEIDAGTEGFSPRVSSALWFERELDDLAGMAARAAAPSSGIVDAAVVGRLLSLPLRTSGSWPVVVSEPASPSDVLAVFDESVPPHVLSIGGSGQGKTTLLVNALRRSIETDRTQLIIDPHGDFAQQAAALFEARGIEHLVIDFGAATPLAWNLTQPPRGADDLVWADDLTTIVLDSWPGIQIEMAGPVYRRSVRTIHEIMIRDPAGPHPLIVFPQLLSPESDLRERALGRIGDPELTRVVEEEILPMVRQRDPGNALSWLTAKHDRLIGDPTVRAIVGQPTSEVDLARLFDGIPIILSVPASRLTDGGSRLLAGTAVSQMWLLLQRLQPGIQIDVFIDEWQKVSSPALPSIITEGRKLGISLRLSNQNASQIPQRLWDTVLANTGGVITFRTGPVDARQLDPLFPSVPVDALTRLPKHWVAVTTGDADFVAPAPAPLGVGDAGAALERGHRRAIGRAEDQRCEQLVLALDYVGSAGEGDGSDPLRMVLEDWIEDRRKRRRAGSAGTPSQS